MLPEDIIGNKILELAKDKLSFSMKEVLALFPNMRESIIKAVFKELREANKIVMHGDKRSAQYALAGKKIEQNMSAKIESEDDLIKLIIKKFNGAGWVSIDTLLEFVDKYTQKPFEVFKKLKELECVEYNASNYKFTDLDKHNEVALTDLYKQILAMFEKDKVYAIPELMEKLQKDRPAITDVIRALEYNGMIYKEGMKRFTKYVWHDYVIPLDANSKEIPIKEKDTNEPAKKNRPEVIDELYLMLVAAPRVTVSVGGSNDGPYSIKVSNECVRVKELSFETAIDCVGKLKQLTTKVEANG